MQKTTYNPENYQPETQAAVKAIIKSWPGYDLEWFSTVMANIIEEAVVEAKKVTEEKVRAACAAVAEVHLSNQKGDPK